MIVEGGSRMMSSKMTQCNEMFWIDFPSVESPPTTPQKTTVIPRSTAKPSTSTWQQGNRVQFISNNSYSTGRQSTVRNSGNWCKTVTKINYQYFFVYSNSNVCWYLTVAIGCRFTFVTMLAPATHCHYSPDRGQQVAVMNCFVTRPYSIPVFQILNNLYISNSFNSGWTQSPRAHQMTVCNKNQKNNRKSILPVLRYTRQLFVCKYHYTFAGKCCIHAREKDWKWHVFLGLQNIVRYL